MSMHYSANFIALLREGKQILYCPIYVEVSTEQGALENAGIGGGFWEPLGDFKLSAPLA